MPDWPQISPDQEARLREGHILRLSGPADAFLACDRSTGRFRASTSVPALEGRGATPEEALDALREEWERFYGAMKVAQRPDVGRP
jgi:hypothetical protein